MKLRPEIAAMEPVPGRYSLYRALPIGDTYLVRTSSIRRNRVGDRYEYYVWWMPFDGIPPAAQWVLLGLYGVEGGVEHVFRIPTSAIPLTGPTMLHAHRIPESPWWTFRIGEPGASDASDASREGTASGG